MATKQIPKVGSSCLISLSELNDIKNLISPINNAKDLRKSVDAKLREFSKQREARWINSIENINKLRENEQKNKFIEAELRRRKIDEEEKKFYDLKTSMTINKAHDAIFQSGDQVKSFLSKMQFCDMLSERKKQIQQNEAIKKRREEYDKYLDDMQNKKFLEENEAEERQKQLMKEKSIAEMKIIKDQLQEFKKKRIIELQDDFVEGKFIKYNAQMELEEEEKKKEQQKLKQEQARLEIKKSNQELEKIKEKRRQEEIEYEKQILAHAQKKQALDELRKKNEKEKFEEKQKRQNELIERQIEHLKKINAEKENRENRDVELKKQKEDEEQRLKQEKYQKFLKEIEENRLLYLQNKAKEKELEKLNDLKMVEDWRKQIKEQQEHDKLLYLQKRKKQKDLVEFQKKQAELKKSIAMQDFIDAQKLAYKNQYKLVQEENDFIKFAENKIQEYHNQGKDILPLLLELKKYRQNSSLE